MALSFKEKRELQKIIAIQQEGLAAGGLSFKAKREAQKAMRDALQKLNVKVEAGKTSELLEQLVAGKFNNLTPLSFIQKVREVVNSIDNDIEPVKPPVIAYCEEKSSSGMILESAKIFEAFQQSNTRSGELTINIDHDFKEPAMFRGQIQCLENAQKGDQVTLKINSFGGRTDAAKAFYVALRETKARTKAKLLTAHSSGAIVAFSCDEIETTPHCEVMIHNGSFGMKGKAGDIQASAEFTQKHFASWYAELFAGFLSPEELQDVMKGQDLYFDEKEINARLAQWTPIRDRGV